MNKLKIILRLAYIPNYPTTTIVKECLDQCKIPNLNMVKVR